MVQIDKFQVYGLLFYILSCTSGCCPICNVRDTKISSIATLFFISPAEDAERNS